MTWTNVIAFQRTSNLILKPLKGKICIFQGVRIVAVLATTLFNAVINQPSLKFLIHFLKIFRLLTALYKGMNKTVVVQNQR